jgi:epoxyqueuosine reductase QueG
MSIHERQTDLEYSLRGNGADLVGFADAPDRFPAGRGDLATAVCVAVALDADRVTACDSDAAAFQEHLTEAGRRVESLVAECAEILRGSGFKTWAPSMSQDEPGPAGDFFHRMAAARAGLGWIGKSGLFVSPDYGCALWLATVLTDAPFATGRPVTQSRCGDCELCVHACPCGAIKGAAWTAGVSRDLLLDAELCARTREKFVSQLGFRHPCGLCIQACPIGR